MDNKEEKLNYIKEHIWLFENIIDEVLHKDVISTIDLAVDKIYDCINGGNKIFFCGCGGSSGDSGHAAAEFPLPAIDLSAFNQTITAIANDYSFVGVFSKPLRALGKTGDVLFAISTSGRSPAVLNAIIVAKKLGLISILLTGEKPDTDCNADIIIKLPSDNTGMLQVAHIMIIHYICKFLDKKILETKKELLYEI